ncbi:MAG: SurA N-terminal domain-containing protein [Bacteroidaceae bacterium]|nr:SurA N-terminal domain-containing protein [Bacteroidaceae bacterium]
MATLQKLRNMGPLLVIFVGLALFAFIAGDAWRLFQSHTVDQNVGSVNGEKLSAMDFQKMYEEYTNAVKFARGTNALTEDEMNQVKDEVWSTYISNQILSAEAEKAGLTVTATELQAIVNAGSDPLLAQTPFRNEKGVFDKDILNNFLTQYDNNKENPEFLEQYKPVYDYWKFIEKTIMLNALTGKYQALVQNSFIGNPIVAKSNYEANSNTYDIEVVAYPYSAVKGDDCVATESEIEKLYNQKKENYKQPYESRSIKYASYRVTPSPADREELRAELSEYADSLKAGDTDYASIVRLASSEVTYSDQPWQKSAFPEEVQARLDSVAVNSVTGPIYSQSDDSYTVFKLLSKSTLPDSVKYDLLVVSAENIEKTNALADSLLGALKGGANFAEVSKKYNQENNEGMWFTSAQYEGMPVASNSLIDKLVEGKKCGYEVVDIENANSKAIVRITESKNPVEKYHAVVIKRANEFSKDTYNDAYNKFSQFVANCKDAADMEAKADEFGFRVMTQNNIHTGTHKVANIAGTRDALRWIFEAAEGDISPLYECGENDYLLVAAVTAVNEKGYAPLENLRHMLGYEIANDKKAKKIMAEIKGKTMEQIKGMENVKSCETKRISFSAPAYISATASNEPAISAIAGKLNIGQESAPIKGNNGVYVIKLVAKNAKGGEFNAKSEEDVIKTMGARNSNNIFGELIQNAEIEDNRYRFF